MVPIVVIKWLKDVIHGKEKCRPDVATLICQDLFKGELIVKEDVHIGQ